MNVYQPCLARLILHYIDLLETLLDACQKRDTVVILNLLEQGANINSSRIRYSQEWPLSVAVKFRSVPTVQLLLDSGASLYPKDKHGKKSMLFNAFLRRTKHFWRNQKIREIIWDAAVPELRTGKHSISDLPNGLLHQACVFGKKDAIEAVLDLGAGIDDFAVVDFYGHGKTPLMVACHSNRTDIVELLLSKDADTNMRGKNQDTALGIACQNGAVKIIKMLLESGADIEDTGGDNDWSTPLFCASWCCKPEAGRILLDHGAKVDGPPNATYTPLHVASSLGHANIVDLLLRYGAKTNIVDEADNWGTPLLASCSQGHLRIVQLLLDYGADINQRGTVRSLVIDGSFPPRHEALEGSNGRRYLHFTPLYLACVFDQTDVVECLLRHNADTNCQGGPFGTPLHVAVRLNRISVVLLLLSTPGVQVNSPWDGKTALDYALQLPNGIAKGKKDSLTSVLRVYGAVSVQDLLELSHMQVDYYGGGAHNTFSAS